MSRSIVTGGAGFIGSALVRLLLREGQTVEVIDNLSSGRRQNLAGIEDRVVLHEADIRNYDTIAPVIAKADYVFHLGALPSVPKSILNPVPSHESNIDGTFNVLRAAAEGKAGRVIYAASSSAYGDTEVLPKTESMTPRPKSPYAVQKLLGEYYASIFPGCFGLEKRSPTIYGDGEQSRDFTFVEDVVELVWKAARAPNVSGRVYNAGNGGRYTLNETWTLLQKIAGVELPAVYGQPRQGDVRHSQADTSAAVRDLGHAPRFTFEQGLKETFEWYKKSETGA